MRIGDLRERVTIQSFSEAPDGGHSLTPTYTDLATVWAKVEDLDGIKKFNAIQIDPLLTHRITIRYRSDVTSEHWILLGTRRFRIRNVANRHERERFLVLECEEAFDQGTLD